MDKTETLLKAALDSLDPKSNYSSRKQAYSQDMSAAIANSFSAALRHRGMKEILPSRTLEGLASGGERRMSGGIGAKKVDVTWSTDECGLIFSASIKTINWRDQKTGNYQKNLTNRRGDMLFESVTLHRRFPYAVLFGFLFLDSEAKNDQTAKRNSTFLNAHHRLKMFTGRRDPNDRDEQYERLYIVLVNANPKGSRFECFHVGEPESPRSLEPVLDEALVLIDRT